MGATMLGTNPNNTAVPLSTPVTAPVCHKNSISCARGDVMTEEVCTFNNGALITSGGGFSQYTAQPSWQASAVQNYIKNTVLPPSSMFNSQNRAFPDVSALGHNYLGGGVVQCVAFFAKVFSFLQCTCRARLCRWTEPRARRPSLPPLCPLSTPSASRWASALSVSVVARIVLGV